MFFRRKPKVKPDQEEPLVPHGLIWQATVQEERQPAPAPPPHVPPSASPPSRQTEVKFDRPPSIRKLGAISPPIPWPSPMVQEITRRPHSHVDTERMAAITMGQLVPAQYREKPQVSPALTTRDTSPPPLKTSPSVVETPQRRALPSPVRNIRPEPSDRFLHFRARCRVLGDSWAKARLEVRANIRAVYAEIHLRERIRHVSELVRQQLRRGLLFPRRVKPTLTFVVNQSKTAHEKLISVPQPIFRRIENWSQRSAAATNKVWQHKVRVGVDAQAWSRLTTRVTALTTRWKAKPLGLKFDSRLWTSMAMAAVSAGMALALVSVIRHYGPEGSPATTGRSVAAPSPRVKPVKNTNLRWHTNLSQRHVLEKPSAARQSAPAGRSQNVEKAPVLASQKMHHRKARPHSSEDDDYVARDTYVYYGTSGKNEH